MQVRKISKSVLAMLLVAGLLWGTSFEAFATSYTDTSADLGGQGVVMPAGLSRDNLLITRIQPGEGGISFASGRLMGPVLDIDYVIDGQELTFPTGLSYVYFTLNGIERNAWEEGRAGIFYRDLSSGAWQSCAPSYLVDGGDQGSSRLTCVMPQYTMYGLVIQDEIKELVPGAQVSEGVENARYLDDYTAVNGNQGVYAPAGIDPEQILVRIMDNSKAPALTNVKSTRPVVRLEWSGDEAAEQQSGVQPEDDQVQLEDGQPGLSSAPVVPLSLTYVYFNLSNRERQLWDDGELSIYSYDPSVGSWVACPSIFVSEEIEGSSGRLACVVPLFTYYALGVPR